MWNPLKLLKPEKEKRPKTQKEIKEAQKKLDDQFLQTVRIIKEVRD